MTLSIIPGMLYPRALDGCDNDPNLTTITCNNLRSKGTLSTLPEVLVEPATSMF